MRRNLLNSLLAAVCGLILWGSASTAEAGFIASTVEPSRGDVVNLQASNDASGMAASTNNEPLHPEQQLLPHLPRFAAQLAPTGSMGAQSLTGSGGSPCPPAIQPTPPVPTTGELTLRLSQQREPYHPRFLKSRLFRPPRA